MLTPIASLTFTVILAFPNAPIPKGELQGIVVVAKTYPKNELHLLTPKGETISRVEPLGLSGIIFEIRLSPNRRSCLVTTKFDDQFVKLPAGALNLLKKNAYRVDFDHPEKKATLLFESKVCSSLVWSPDGQSIYFSDADPDEIKNVKLNELIPYRSWKMEGDNKTPPTPIATPKGHSICDIADDGKSLITRTLFNEANLYRQSRPFRFSFETKQTERLIDQSFSTFRLSPSGSRLVGHRKIEDDPMFIRGQPYVCNFKDETSSRVSLPTGTQDVTFICWSPDGKKLAYQARLPFETKGDPIPIYVLTVCDPDGANPNIIARNVQFGAITCFDWR